MAKSIVDYIFRWMALKFLSVEDQRAVGINAVEEKIEEETTLEVTDAEVSDETKKAQVKMFENKVEETAQKTVEGVAALGMTFDNMSDSPACDTCGSVMVRNGACYKCLNCGATSGCS